MSMILLREQCSDIEILHENTSSGKKLYIEGIFAQAELSNGNGRFYPKAVMESAVDKYNTEYVKARRALGEINHPERPFADPRLAAIIVEKLEWHGNNVVGKALVMPTNEGRILAGLLESGFALGVSTRGLGSLRESGGRKYVNPGFMMTAIDAVDLPSGPDCYVNALHESRWQQVGGQWVPASVREQQISEAIVLERFESFLKTLKPTR